MDFSTASIDDDVTLAMGPAFSMISDALGAYGRRRQMLRRFEPCLRAGIKVSRKRLSSLSELLRDRSRERRAHQTSPTSKAT